MKTVQIGKMIFDVPTSFEEASEPQRLVFAMASVVALEKRDRAFWEWLVMNGLGCSARFWQRLTLSYAQWFELCKVFEWVFLEKCEIRPCASFKVDTIEYLLPATDLNDTDAIDFSVAALWFTEMANAENNVDALHELMGALCRPRRNDLAQFMASDNWDGDEREVYNEHRAGERAKIFAKVDMGLKVAFVHWWEYEFKKFIETYDELFGNAQEEPRYNDGRGWLMVLKHVAQKGYLGKLADVHSMNVHEVWCYMLDDAMDNRAQAPGP